MSPTGPLTGPVDKHPERAFEDIVINSNLLLMRYMFYTAQVGSTVLVFRVASWFVVSRWGILVLITRYFNIWISDYLYNII